MGELLTTQIPAGDRLFFLEERTIAMIVLALR